MGVLRGMPDQTLIDDDAPVGRLAIGDMMSNSVSAWTLSVNVRICNGLKILRRVVS